MHPLRRYTLFSILLLLASAAWIVFTRPAPGESTDGAPAVARKGFPAPDFTLQTLGGDTVVLSDLRGQPVILNLWASWCPPCRAEMPALQRVHASYAEQGLIILAVNLTAQDSAQAAAQFAGDNGLTFPIPLDVDNVVGQKYHTSALPTTFFIAADGVIQDVIVGGPIPEALFRAQAEQLLAEVR